MLFEKQLLSYRVFTDIANGQDHLQFRERVGLHGSSEISDVMKPN